MAAPHCIIQGRPALANENLVDMEIQESQGQTTVSPSKNREVKKEGLAGKGL